MYRFRDSHILASASLLMAILLVVGCGGGESEPSLSEQYAAALKVSNPASRATDLIKVAKKQIEAKDRAGADRSLAAAVSAGNSADEPRKQAEILLRVVDAYTELGKETEAEDLLKDIAKMANKIDDPAKRVAVLGDLAVALERNGQKDNAKLNLGAAASAAKTLPDPIKRSIALREIAAAYFELGDLESGNALVQTAIETAKSLEGTRAQVDELVALADILQKVKETDKAKELLAEAETLTEQINEEDYDTRGYALLGIAKVKIKIGEKADATKLLGAAEKAAKGISNRTEKERLLKQIREAQ
jgi:tetratricopeptide (TPR) repeat protein